MYAVSDEVRFGTGAVRGASNAAANRPPIVSSSSSRFVNRSVTLAWNVMAPVAMSISRATTRRSQHELVQQRAEVALAGAAIDDRGCGVTGEGVVERRLQQPDEVADLLELAARIRVELTLAREQVEVLEQRDRHALWHIRVRPWIDLL